MTQNTILSQSANWTRSVPSRSVRLTQWQSCPLSLVKHELFNIKQIKRSLILKLISSSRPHEFVEAYRANKYEIIKTRRKQDTLVSLSTAFCLYLECHSHAKIEMSRQLKAYDQRNTWGLMCAWKSQNTKDWNPVPSRTVRLVETSKLLWFTSN